MWTATSGNVPEFPVFRPEQEKEAESIFKKVDHLFICKKETDMGKIKQVVFDLGGVVLHLDRQEAVRRFEAMGIREASRMLDAYHQNGVFLQVEDGTLNAEQFCDRIREMAGQDLPCRTIAEGWLGFVREVPLYKLDYIRELRKQYGVYLLSNTNPFMMEWARSPGFTPQGHPITDYFDRIYTSYELKMVKPDPAIFDHILKDAGLDPEETLFLDDGEANVQAASRFGIRVYRPEDGEDWRPAVDAILQE